MARIQVSHLTFGYDGSPDLIFDDASFQIDTDWKLGFVGRNGRGKTTLLRLLMGKLNDHGAISAPTQFDYFPFSVSDPSLTPLEIAAQMDKDGQVWRFLKEISDLDVKDEALCRPFSSLSGGEQGKVLIAALFAREHHFLLIDEPTNHLDLAGREIMSRYLNGKKGFILVSHDRAFLDGCVDHILSINRANIDIQKGNFSSWEENKRRQDQFELDENERLKKDISALRSAARQAHAWADHAESIKIGIRPGGREKSMDARAYYGEKSRRMQQRRKNLEKRMDREIEDKEQLLKNLEKSDELKIAPLRHPSARLVTMKEVTLSFSDTPLFTNLSLEIMAGDVLALTGPNGCGKSSLLKLITGELSPQSGEIRLASGLVLSIVPQLSPLSGTLKQFIEEAGIDETLFKTILRKLDFQRDQFDKDISSFSAGQKKKALIARSLCQQAHLYLWDEPLNYIDVISRMQIERLIKEFRPTMVLVEHDRAFIDHVATRVLPLDKFQ